MKVLEKVKVTAKKTDEVPICNTKITPEIMERLEYHLEKDELLKIIVVTDVDLDGNFSQNIIAITDKHIISTDKTRKDIVFDIKDIEALVVKRMYGNILLGIRRADKIEFFNRGTFSVVDSFETVTLYINELLKGKAEQEMLESVNVSFKKHRLYCPRCGARLQSEGLPCIKCANKKKVYSRLLKYAKPQMRLLVFSLILAVITTVISLVPPLLTKQLVDNVLVNVENLSGVLIDQKLKSLFGLVIMLLVINLVSILIGAVRGYYLRKASEKTVTGIKSDLYTKAQYLPVQYYDKTSSGSVISRINADTMTLNNFIVTITQSVFTQFIQLIGIAIVMFSMDPVLSFLSLLPIPIVVLCTKKFDRFMRPYYTRIWVRCAKINSILADTLPGIRIVKAFTSEKKSISSFKRSLDDLVDENLKTFSASTLYNASTSVLLLFGNLVIWGLGGFMVITGQTFLGGNILTAGGLVAFISYMSMFYTPVQFFVSLNETFVSSITAAERVFEMMDTDEEEDLGKGNIFQNPVKGEIEFRNVSFSYESGKKTLDNVSFKIKTGEVVGIVGTTGSGKSTIVNLILRYYSDYEGEILLDGVDIRDIDINFYRSSIGYVLQEPLLFNDTIYNNIAYNNPKARTEDVLNAAITANAHTFISRFPDCYDTMLGERGVGLSGGEKQRLSIARAVLKDPSILILDEATSAVDSETEQVIQEAIERIIKGRTTIMIAHRLSTLKKADKIIVVEHGTITESGSHEELIAKNGKYARLVHIQSLAKGLIEEEEIINDGAENIL